MTLEQQAETYRSLRALLGWRELRGFDPTDCWMQRDGIAVWITPDGLCIGLKNTFGGGYTGLENHSSHGLRHPPREKLEWPELCALWLDAYGRKAEAGDYKLCARLVVIFSHLGVLSA